MQPLCPSLYQVNTRIWLNELGQAQGRPATLDDIPDADLDRLAQRGFDWVWLLGVWQTGAAGREVSRRHPDWRREFQAALRDLREDDIIGSPFAVRRYAVAADMGGDAALARLRERLRQRGLRLMLDFVPNHTALDHPWVGEHPEFYVHGTEELLAREPGNYCRVTTGEKALILAHGRDPYFPGWPDTLQLNYRHAGLRAAMISELERLATQCDGVRCDMAMLVLPDVFLRTWHSLSLPSDGSPPVEGPFWPEAIARVRRRHPDFVFMAEVYWDLEWTLQQQGFDYTYDKRLYDRLHLRDAAEVRRHLEADREFQRKLVRFLENHDEPRAASAFPPPVHQAAAVIAFFVPGMRFFHNGQLEGRRVRVPVHLGRRPEEPADLAIRQFYDQLLACLDDPLVRSGRWRLLACRPAWADNPTWSRFLAFSWEEEAPRRRWLVAVNYGPTRGQCYVSLPYGDLGGRTWRLQDRLGPATYERDGDDLADRGLYLDMPEWGYHLFELTPA